MKKIITIIFVAISILTFSQDTAMYKITIEIENIKNTKGEIVLHMYDKEENTIKKMYSSEIINKTCTFEIDSLVEDKYAVWFFHNENNDNYFNNNKLGFPTEGYGFSNNAMNFLGMPKPFEKWLFTVDENKKFVFKMRYL